MKLRPEVEEALRGVRAKYGPGRKPTRTQLLALVELGVRLGLEAAADEFLDEVPSLSIHIRQRIETVTPADILQAQLGEEGE